MRLLIFFALAVASATSFAAPPGDALGRAQKAVDDFEFEAADAQLDVLLARDDLTEDQRAQAALLSGVVARTLGNNKKAAERFNRALDLDPDIKPDAIYGPKITKFFAKQKKKHTPPDKSTLSPTNDATQATDATDATGDPLTNPTDDTTAKSPNEVPTADPQPDDDPHGDAESGGFGLLPIGAGIFSAAAGFGAVVASAAALGSYFVVSSPNFEPSLRNYARFGWLGGAAAGAGLVVIAFAGVATTATLILLE